MAPPMTHSEPAREAVACLYTVQGDSQPFMRISRGMLHVAGDIVAVQPLGPLPASPAPAAGAEAVREIEAIFRRHLQANDYAKDLIKRIAFDVVPAVRKALSAALAPSTSAATACNLVPPPETYGGSGDDPWTGRMPSTSAATRGEPWTVESLAQWLHDEAEHQESYPHHHWPEHPDDDGNRDGGFVKIVPQHAQAYFRQLAARCLGIRPFSGRYFEAIGATPPAPAVESAQVKVKPLEWVKHPSANVWRAECSLGVYQLYAIQTPVWLFDGFTDRVHDKRADSVGAGFAAAQADYEARIRASLATDVKE